ncbi:STAS domain-containing protein [Actinomycetes bacterium M1A6_2h]
MTVSFTPTTDNTTSADLGALQIPGGRIVSTRVRPDTLLFTVSGSLDLANVQRFGDCVSSAAQHADKLIIDLSDVDFIGTAALSVLSDIDSNCGFRGTTMTLVTGTAAERVITAARWVPNTAPQTTVADALSV